MTARVVNLYKEPFDVYIGRTFKGREGSKYGNPFVVGRDGTLEEVIDKYKSWLWKQIVNDSITIKELADLDGKRLGCYCKPKGCHGDVLVKAIEWACKQEMKNEMF